MAWATSSASRSGVDRRSGSVAGRRSAVDGAGEGLLHSQRRIDGAAPQAAPRGSVGSGARRRGDLDVSAQAFLIGTTLSTAPPNRLISGLAPPARGTYKRASLSNTRLPLECFFGCRTIRLPGGLQ